MARIERSESQETLENRNKVKSFLKPQGKIMLAKISEFANFSLDWAIFRENFCANIHLIIHEYYLKKFGFLNKNSLK